MMACIDHAAAQRVAAVPGRRPVRAPYPASSQQGQALVLGLLFAGAVSLAFVRYFDTGMAVAEKARQDHALDAAAYSGALVQARSLNMLAYINRAQVAHQVAMAHLVTLGSWGLFSGTEAGRLLAANPPAHVIGMHFGSEHAAAYLAAAKAAGMGQRADEHGPLASAYIEHDRLSRAVLASASSRVAGELAATRDRAMREVLAANYPGEADFELAISDDAAPGFLAAYAANPRLRPFIHEVAALYRFLDPRDHIARSRFPVDGRCPAWRHELRRRGRTVLGEEGVWQSIDTQSYHAARSNRWVGCYFREYAMGWGWVPPRQSVLLDAPYVDDPPDNFADQDFWRWVREATSWDISGGNANPLANSWAHAARRQWAGGGLPAYHSLASPRGMPSAHFSVSLRRRGRAGMLFTSNTAAEAYFRRPEPRGDGRRELPNVFHPYWQARLRAPGGRFPSLQGGQALVESLVATMALAVLWVAIHWLAHYQDMALSAVHASRHLAFLATRAGPPSADPSQSGPLRAPSPNIEPGHIERFFTGDAHRWVDRRGTSVMDVATSLEPTVHREPALSAWAQPGGPVRHVARLRDEWLLEDQGMLAARVALDFPETERVANEETSPLRLSRFDRSYDPLSRRVVILAGAGHAQSDDAAQSRMASSLLAWGAAHAGSRTAGLDVAGGASGVDAGWSRPPPQFDWLSAWRGGVPGEYLETRQGN